ncbi:MAG TPA: AAA family ATPase [Micromonosporaceae bacterium]|nr:AAA family ATPase [Micromonosporaceae bacterium]
MIVWINGTHGAGKTTTSALVQQLIPDSRVFDAEKVGETLMDITPGLPDTDNFQHWPPWRQLVVETAHSVLDYTGGTLVMPMTVLVEQYWREISAGLAHHAIPVRHFVLHADSDTLRRRIEGEHVIPSPFRLKHLEPYAEAARTWLHSEAEVIDTTYLTPAQVAQQIAEALKGRDPALARAEAPAAIPASSPTNGRGHRDNHRSPPPPG